jgi:hypothetical protein
VRGVGECPSLVGVDLLGEVHHLGEQVVEFRGGLGYGCECSARFCPFVPTISSNFSRPFCFVELDPLSLTFEMALRGLV